MSTATHSHVTNGSPLSPSNHQDNKNNTRPKRILNLITHIPTFLLRFIRLVVFVIVLFPAFCVFLWHYLTCDRVSVYYGNDCSCENEFDNENNNLNGRNDCTSEITTYHQFQCKTCRPFFSRHYLDIYGSASPSPRKKPVLLFLTGGAYIIGYKMWGTLLARALAQHILVIVPDYRNYPRVSIEGMVEDVDKSIEWALRNVGEYGGDAAKIVVVGQSAGAHLGGLVVVKKVLDRLRRLRCIHETADQVNGSWRDNDGHTFFTTTYEANQLCGFISTSSPHNLVTMRQVFHRHGLSCSVQRSIFGGVENDAKEGNSLSSEDDVFEKWSTFHLVKKCQEEYLTFIDRVGVTSNAVADFDLQDLFPNLCVIHGTNDNTVPVEESIEFLSLLARLKIPCKTKFYDNWTHTDPILEAPMRGNHLYHKDVYELVRLWTCNKQYGVAAKSGNPDRVSNGNRQYILDNGSMEDTPATLPDLDEQHPMLRSICPSRLVEIARICNPF